MSLSLSKLAMSKLAMSKLATAALALVVSAGLAFAQAPQAAPPATTPPPAAVTKDVAPVKKTAPAAKKGPVAAVERSPESIACSAELDAKGIHGKAAGRQKLLNKCKADALKKKKAEAGVATPATPAKTTAPPAKK